MAKSKGLFISLEGCEGSGKTTQLKLLVKKLKKQGYDVLVTREPGGTVLGMKLRNILLHTDGDWSRRAETLLYMASRAELVEKVIKPALKGGKIVVCDRWLDATIAYQGYGLGVPPRWISQIAQQAVLGVTPHITFLLDIPVEKGLKRAKKRGRLDRIEKRALLFHKRVRRGYLKLASSTKRIQKIKSDSIQNTHLKIYKILEKKLGI